MNNTKLTGFAWLWRVFLLIVLCVSILQPIKTKKSNKSRETAGNNQTPKLFCTQNRKCLTINKICVIIYEKRAFFYCIYSYQIRKKRPKILHIKYFCYDFAVLICLKMSQLKSQLKSQQGKKYLFTSPSRITPN